MSKRAALSLVAAFVALSFFLMAHDFAMVVADGGSPIRPEQYGEQVYAISAVIWIAAQQYAAAIAGFGALIVAADGKWVRIGALASGLGWTALAALFVFFAYLSAGRPEGALLHAGAKYPGVMSCTLFAVLAGRVFFWGDDDE